MCLCVRSVVLFSLGSTRETTATVADSEAASATTLGLRPWPSPSLLSFALRGCERCAWTRALGSRSAPKLGSATSKEDWERLTLTPGRERERQRASFFGCFAEVALGTAPWRGRAERGSALSSAAARSAASSAPAPRVLRLRRGVFRGSAPRSDVGSGLRLPSCSHRAHLGALALRGAVTQCFALLCSNAPLLLLRIGNCEGLC